MTLIDKAETLLPCPFCGEAAYNDNPTWCIFGKRTGHGYAIACSNCEAVATGDDDPALAIAAWNRRAIPARGVGVQWQNINTAPRGGEWFIARTEHGTTRVVHFADEYDRFPISHDDAVWPTAPTEWTPLKPILAALPAVTPKVRPLAWAEQNGVWSAETIIGEYSVGFDDGWWCELSGPAYWDWEPSEDRGSYCGPSAAMTAAQADYEARILAALEPTDAAHAREAALRDAAAVCDYVIKNIDILKADGETYETPRVQKIARGLVEVARQDILALIGETRA